MFDRVGRFGHAGPVGYNQSKNQISKIKIEEAFGDDFYAQAGRSIYVNISTSG